MRNTLVMAVAAAAMTVLTASPGLSQNLTLQQIDPTRPFGEIDVTLSLLDPRSIEAWAGGLSPERQAELRNRCEVMVANPSSVDISAVAFCRTLLGR